MNASKLSDSEFEEKVINSSLPTMIDFWAEWCGPCRQLAPTVEQLAEEMSDKINIVKMNIDENPETPSKYGVKGIPALIIFKDGKPIATKVGTAPKNDIKQWIEDNI